MGKIIYLDNAATTPILKEVGEKMTPYIYEKYGNPSSIHSVGRETKIEIERVRQLISEELKCNRGEIIFTSGGTESINKIIFSSINDLGCTRIITSKLEHHATLHTAEYLQKTKNITLEYVKNFSNGTLDYVDLENLLKQNSEKTLITLLHANNEIGNINDAKLISQIGRKYNALINLDTVQTLAHYKINLTELDIDFLSCSAHKFHGPKGIGFIYIKNKNKISSILHGGGQERNMRAGTENIIGIIGLGKAFEIAYLNLEKNQKYIIDLKNYLFKNLEKEFVGIKLFGDENFNNSLYTVLNIGFIKNEKTELLTLNLDIEGICISSGSACSSGSEISSGVISNLDFNYIEKYQPIRFSFSHLNTKEELDEVIIKLKNII